RACGDVRKRTLCWIVGATLPPNSLQPKCLEASAPSYSSLSADSSARSSICAVGRGLVQSPAHRRIPVASLCPDCSKAVESSSRLTSSGSSQADRTPAHPPQSLGTRWLPPCPSRHPEARRPGACSSTLCPGLPAADTRESQMAHDQSSLETTPIARGNRIAGKSVHHRSDTESALAPGVQFAPEGCLAPERQLRASGHGPESHRS